MANKSVIFAGSFDPFTTGHYELVKSAAQIFDKIIIAPANQTQKQSCDILLRQTIIQTALKDMQNIEIIPFDGLLVDFAKELNIKTIMRGLRNTNDFEYERSLAEIYRRGGLDCVYFMPPAAFAHISSSIVRELVLLNADIKGLVCENTREYITGVYGKK